MDRREFLVGTAVVGVGAATMSFSSEVSAATCETNLYNLPKAVSRLNYPLQSGETPPPINFEWPPGHVRRYV